MRSEYRKPGNTASGRSLPKADAIIVPPATYNTINKCANGTSDNYALGILAEAVGLRTPVVVLPFVNSALASHPAFQRSVALLRDAGINVIHGPGRLEPHPPGPEATGSTRFPGTKRSPRPTHFATRRDAIRTTPRRSAPRAPRADCRIEPYLDKRRRYAAPGPASAPDLPWWPAVARRATRKTRRISTAHSSRAHRMRAPVAGTWTA